MTTSAPATGWPEASTTSPLRPAEVLCAKAGAAASAASRPRVRRDIRTGRRWFIDGASCKGVGGRKNECAAPAGQRDPNGVGRADFRGVEYRPCGAGRVNVSLTAYGAPVAVP